MFIYQWLPSRINLDGYRGVVGLPFAPMLNSFIVAIAVTVSAGYERPGERLRPTGSGGDVVFMIYLSAMMIPHKATVIRLSF